VSEVTLEQCHLLRALRDSQTGGATVPGLQAATLGPGLEGCGEEASSLIPAGPSLSLLGHLLVL
jgi:hypothetical protein